MKFVSVTELSTLGKSAVAAIVSAASLLQIDGVKNVVIPFVSHHPHIATITGAVLTLSALLTNPQVQKVLHLENVAVKNATVSGDVTVTPKS